MFLHPVVVAGDRPRADVDLGTNRRIAEIRQMIDLRLGSKCGFLQLYERSYVRFRPDGGFRSQVGERTDRGTVGNVCADDHAEIFHGDVTAERRVGDSHIRLDLAGRADLRVAFENDRWMNHGVRADLHVLIDVCGTRINERDPGGHEFLVLLLS